MFIVAMGLISVGYVVGYWGINNLIAWRSKDEGDGQYSSLSRGTDAVEMGLLFGVPYTPTLSTTVQTQGWHEVPFPFHPKKSGGEVRPVETAPIPNSPNNPPKNQPIPV